MVAGEARHPRKTMPKAFNQTIYRLLFFYFGSAIAIGEPLVVCVAEARAPSFELTLSCPRNRYSVPLQRPKLARRYCCRCSRRRDVPLRVFARLQRLSP